MLVLQFLAGSAAIAGGVELLQDSASGVDIYGDPLPDGALARMGTHRFWSGSEIDNLTFSPRGDLLASTSNEPPGLILWDTINGHTVRRLVVPEPQLPVGFGGFAAVAFAPNGELVAAMGDEVVVIWNLATGRLVRVVGDLHGRVLLASFSFDGVSMVAADDDGAISFRTGADAPRRRIKMDGESIKRLALSPDGKVLATSFRDGTFRLWDVATGDANSDLPLKVTLDAQRKEGSGLPRA